MITVGIDLATRRSPTGYCRLRWHEVGIDVASVEVKNYNDDELLNLMQQDLSDGAWIAIDAPFGFPCGFAKAVSEMATGLRVTRHADRTLPGLSWLPKDEPPQSGASLDELGLQRRRTDSVVHDRLETLRKRDGWASGSSTWPLSSVTERITPTTVRCAVLRSELKKKGFGPIVDERVVEVYPIASLRLWNIETRDYKNKKKREDRESMLEQLTQKLNLKLTSRQRRCLDGSDDCIDALVAALTARVAADPGRPSWPDVVNNDFTPEERSAVDREGWIHLPPEHSDLSQLQKLCSRSEDD